MDIAIIKRLVVLLLLWGCQTSPAWQVSHQGGSEKQFDSARLSYPVRDKVNEVAVEMVYAKDNLRTYLAVYSQMIPPYLGNPKEALVIIKTAKETVQATAHRHEGGQRATLPKTIQDLLVGHLLAGTPVTIELEGYSTTLQPEDFAHFYQEMQKAPLNIPIQLPFKL